MWSRFEWHSVASGKIKRKSASLIRDCIELSPSHFQNGQQKTKSENEKTIKKISGSHRKGAYYQPSVMYQWTDEMRVIIKAIMKTNNDVSDTMQWRAIASSSVWNPLPPIKFHTNATDVALCKIVCVNVERVLFALKMEWNWDIASSDSISTLYEAVNFKHFSRIMCAITFYCCVNYFDFIIVC